MAALPLNVCHKKHHQGLTLIEVLIALAIIAIAMTAIIKASSQNIRSTSYLEEKTIALWVGQEVLNESLMGILKLPNHPDQREDEMTMLNKTLYWQGFQENTPNKHIKKIKVNVFNHEIKDEDESPLISLESYRYHEE